MAGRSPLPGLAWSTSVMFLMCASAFGGQHKLHEVMSKSQHSQFFSDEQGPEYDLVTPTARDASGQFLSNQLHLTGDVLNERRQRRHADNSDAEKTFLHLSAFGEDHHMQLTRNRRMVHEQFSINVHESDGEMRTHTVDTDCYHHGQLSGHDDTEIAMATCDGDLMGTIRRKREIFHVHPLPSSLRNHEAHNPDGHTHIVHRVREKKQGDGGFNENAEKMRERAKRQVVLPAVNITAHFCHEDGKIKPPMSSEPVLEQTMFVDMADTLVLNEFQPRSTPVSREFGNNYVHAAIFIDHTMVEKYDGDEAFLVRYHLAMFNIINLIYQPQRTRYSVFIVIINIRIFHRPQPGLFITQDSSRLLNNFCEYQMSLNPAIGHPLRWNHAFLVTGYGLCFRADRDCGELGRAPIEGVCIPDRECSVNREGGLNTAFVLAHELGHNLGMFHDGHPTEAANCPNSEGFLMAPSTGDAARLWEFSPCSKSHLRRYLRNDFSACLDKGSQGPTRQSDLTNQLRSQCSVPPGRLYNREEQCRLQFRHEKARYHPGHSFKFCSRTSYGRRDICKHLYCDNGRSDLGCFSTYTPAMDGTVCGTNRVCWRYQCVPAEKMNTEGNYCAPDVPGPTDIVDVTDDIDRVVTTGAPATTSPPLPVDGSWSFYSALSQCSRSCGGGIRYRERRCTSPPPSNGGRPCEGNTRMYETCNNDPCPGGRSYRQVQCQRLGSSWHESQTSGSENPCSLWCEQRNLDGSVRRRHYAAPAVDDGVRCRMGQSDNDRCIRDQCVVVGCDNIINSTAKVDECGVCKGVGDTCRLWSGSIQGGWTNFGFHRIRLRGTGYSIPKGSWDIQLNFTTASTANIMVLRNNDPSARTYFLHGPGTAIRSGSFAFPVAGTIGQYFHRSNTPQRINIKQKTNTPLVLEVLYWPTRGRPATIDFKFKSQIIPPSESLTWRTTRDYGTCSVTCGRGVQTKSVRCFDKVTGGFKRDFACIRAGHPKPVVQRECMHAPCGFTAVFQQLQEMKPCTSCAGQIQSSSCIVLNPTTGETQDAHPRICNRMQRMAKVESCPESTCEAALRYCHSEDMPMCAWYKGKDCPSDIMSLCPVSCNSCAIMT